MNRASVRGFVACFSLVGFFGIIGLLVFKAPSAEVRELLNVLLGALGMNLGSMYSFYFGSSEEKDGR